MARKHRNGAVPTSVPPAKGYISIPPDVKLRWINPSLTVEDKRWLESHLDELPGVLAGLAESLVPGFVLSCKYGVRDECWVATIVCQDAEHEAAAQAISVRGSTASRALVILAYHLFLLDGEPWWNEGGATSAADW